MDPCAIVERHDGDAPPKVAGREAVEERPCRTTAAAPEARDFTNRRVRRPWGEDEVERLRNRTKSRTRARVEHAFLVLKRLWGFDKVRYRGLAKNATRTFTALAMVNLFMAARRVPALLRP